MGFPSAQALWRNVYGDGEARAGVDLSRPLGRLLDRMPRGFTHNLGSLLRQHTLFPYLTFSMSPSRRRRIEESLSSENSATQVRLWFGRWNVKPPSYLLYCSTCVVEDRKSPGGFAYWRRCHQLPGVVVCPKHCEALTVTSYERPRWYKYRDFLSLDRVAEEGNNRRLEVPNHLIGRAHQVAVDSLWLLQNPDVGDGVLLRRHKDWQYTHGWRHKKGGIQGKLRRSAFCEAVREFYDEEFLRLLSEGEDSLVIPKSGGWVLRMAGRIKEEVADPPLQHILLWQFLGLDGESFFEEPEDLPSPITRKPLPALEGPCPNTTCRQHDPPVPRPLQVSEERKHDSLTISCPECQFTYNQLFDCTSRRRIVIRKTGKLWDDRVRSLLKRDPPLTLAAIAQEMDFSPYMIQKHALRLNAWRSEWSDPVRKMVDRKSLAKKREKERRRLRREEWLRIRKDFPDASRTELQNVNRALANYLSSNDKNWYNKNSPPKYIHRKYKKILKWKNIDECTLPKIKNIIEKIRLKNPPTRITIHSISTRIGQVGTLQKRISEGKIPKTKKYIEKYSESRKQYAVRKLKNGIKYFSEKESIPAFSTFTKKSRVKKKSYPIITRSAFTALRAHLEDKQPIPEQWKIETVHTRSSAM